MYAEVEGRKNAAVSRYTEDLSRTLGIFKQPPGGGGGSPYLHTPNSEVCEPVVKGETGTYMLENSTGLSNLRWTFIAYRYLQSQFEQRNVVR